MTFAVVGSGDYGLAYDVHRDPAADKSAPSRPVADPETAAALPPPAVEAAPPLTGMFAAPASVSKGTAGTATLTAAITPAAPAPTVTYQGVREEALNGETQLVAVGPPSRNSRVHSGSGFLGALGSGLEILGVGLSQVITGPLQSLGESAWNTVRSVPKGIDAASSATGAPLSTLSSNDSPGPHVSSSGTLLQKARISGTFEAGRNDLFVEGFQAYFQFNVEREGDRRIVLTERH